MYTYESVSAFVEQRLNWAKQESQGYIVRGLEAQAFGVLQFVADQCYKTQPELNIKLIKMWNEVWHDAFFEIELKLRG